MIIGSVSSDDPAFSSCVVGAERGAGSGVYTDDLWYPRPHIQLIRRLDGGWMCEGHPAMIGFVTGCPVSVYVDTGIDPALLSLAGYAAVDDIDIAYPVFLIPYPTDTSFCSDSSFCCRLWCWF